MQDRKFLSILLLLGVISVPIVYAEPEFSFEFGTSGSGNANLNNPTDVIVDKNGNKIYVVDNNNNRINVFDDDGDYDFQYGTFCDMAAVQNCNSNADGANQDGDGQFNNPLSIAINILGKFFVVDSDNERIQVFDDDGEFQSKFGSSDSGDDEYLGQARGIAIRDSSRDIYVSDIERDSISIFDSSENFVTSFDSFDGNDDFQNPTNMVIDNSNDMLYVIDGGNDRIVVFELVDGTTCPSGTEEAVDGVCFVKKFGTTGSDPGEFDDPSGLAFDTANDLLFVSDTDNNRIQIFNMISGNTCPAGTQEIVDGVCFLEEFGSTGSGDGEFDTPMGIAFDNTNDLLFVADSDNDRIQAFTVDVEPPTQTAPAPDNLKASPVSATSIMISWEKPELAENVPDITGYKIEYKVGSGEYIVITENSGSATSFIHKGLDTQNTYFYRVYSVNSEGVGVPSPIISEKPKHTTTPAGLIATAISPNQIKLTWLPPSDTFGQTINGYEIKREVISGVYDTVGNVDDDTTTFVVSNLETDKTYTFAISANVGYGMTQESETASATPREDSVDNSTEPITSTEVDIAVSTPPIKLTATAVSATQINLSWSPPVKDGNSTITGYKIEVKKDEGTFGTIVADSESTNRSYSHKNLSTNSKYTYRVSAINEAGISEPSNEFSATPKANNIQISPIGKLSIDEGKTLSFAVKLIDNSVKDMVFSLEKNPPQGAKIISNTGMFSWTPSASDGGKTYVFDVVVKKDGNTDRKELTITVNDSMINPVTEPTEPEDLGLAPFVDESKDPQSYVDRYNNEKTYKDWFDKTYPEYESIYQAVGLEEPQEPKPKEKKYGICGPGTKLIEGVCTVVVKPVVKPWWQFW